MPEQKFITIDVGTAYTKVFSVDLTGENKLVPAKPLRAPTSQGDPSFTVNYLLSKLAGVTAPKIFVSDLPEVEKVAKKFKGAFVTEKAAASFLVNFLKRSNFTPVLLDAGATSLQENPDVETIGKYLTFAASAIFLENYFANKKARTVYLPQDVKELELEEALIRTFFAKKLSAVGDPDHWLIVGTGGIVSGTPSLPRLALIFLDVLRKGEVAQIYFDREFFLPSFGALLSTYKQLAVSTPGSWLEPLGAFISFGGPTSCELDWGFSQVQRIELEADEISVIPALADQEIKVTFAFGLSSKEKRVVEVSGGSIGLVFDAREKPLSLVAESGSSRHKVAGWLARIEQAKIIKEVF